MAAQGEGLLLEIEEHPAGVCGPQAGGGGVAGALFVSQGDGDSDRLAHIVRVFGRLHDHLGGGREGANLVGGAALLGATLIQIAEEPVHGAHRRLHAEGDLVVGRDGAHVVDQVAKVPVGRVTCLPGVVGEAVAHLHVVPVAVREVADVEGELAGSAPHPILGGGGDPKVPGPVGADGGGRVADDEDGADGLILKGVAVVVQQHVVHRPDAKGGWEYGGMGDGYLIAGGDGDGDGLLFEDVFVRVEEDQPGGGRVLAGSVLEAHRYGHRLARGEVGVGATLCGRPQRAPGDQVAPDAVVIAGVLVVAAPPVGVNGRGYDVAVAVGIEQRRRVAVLVPVEEGDSIGRVGGEVAVHQDSQVILVEAGEGLVVLGEVDGGVEAGLVLTPAVATQTAGEGGELVALLLGRDQDGAAPGNVGFQAGAEGGGAFQPVEAAGGDEQDGVEGGHGGSKVHVQDVVGFAQRVEEGSRFLGEAVPEDGDARGAAVDGRVETSEVSETSEVCQAGGAGGRELRRGGGEGVVLVVAAGAGEDAAEQLKRGTLLHAALCRIVECFDDGFDGDFSCFSHFLLFLTGKHSSYEIHGSGHCNIRYAGYRRAAGGGVGQTGARGAQVSRCFEESVNEFLVGLKHRIYIAAFYGLPISISGLHSRGNAIHGLGHRGYNPVKHNSAGDDTCDAPAATDDLPGRVCVAHRVVKGVGVAVLGRGEESCSLQRVPAGKAANQGIVVARAVVIQAALRIILPAGEMIGVDHAARLPQEVAENVIPIRGHDVLARIRQTGDAPQPIAVVGVGRTTALHGDPLVQRQAGRVAGHGGAGGIGLQENVLVVVEIVGRLPRGVGPAHTQPVWTRIVGEAVGPAIGVGDGGQVILVIVGVGGDAAGVHLASQVAVVVVGVGDGLGRRLLVDQLVGIVVNIGRCADNGINCGQAVADGIVGVLDGAAVGVDNLRQPVQRIVTVGGLAAIILNHPGAIARCIVLVGVAGDDLTAGLVVGHRLQPVGLIVFVGDVGGVTVVLSYQPAGRIVGVGCLPRRAGQRLQLVAGGIFVGGGIAVGVRHRRPLAHGVVGVTERFVLHVLHGDVHLGRLATDVTFEAKADISASLGDHVPHGVVISVVHIVLARIVHSGQLVGIVVGVGRDVPVGVGAAHQVVDPIVDVSGGMSQGIGLARQAAERIVSEGRDSSSSVADGCQIATLVVGVLGDVPQRVCHPNQPAFAIIVIQIGIAFGVGHAHDVATGVVRVGRPLIQSIHRSNRPAQGIVLQGNSVVAGVGLAEQIPLAVESEGGGEAQGVGHYGEVTVGIVAIEKGVAQRIGLGDHQAVIVVGIRVHPTTGQHGSDQVAMSIILKLHGVTSGVGDAGYQIKGRIISEGGGVQQGVSNREEFSLAVVGIGCCAALLVGDADRIVAIIPNDGPDVTQTVLDGRDPAAVVVGIRRPPALTLDQVNDCGAPMDIVVRKEAAAHRGSKPHDPVAGIRDVQPVALWGGDLGHAMLAVVGELGGLAQRVGDAGQVALIVVSIGDHARGTGIGIGDAAEPGGVANQGIGDLDLLPKGMGDAGQQALRVVLEDQSLAVGMLGASHTPVAVAVEIVGSLVAGGEDVFACLGTGQDIIHPRRCGKGATAPGGVTHLTPVAPGDDDIAIGLLPIRNVVAELPAIEAGRGEDTASQAIIREADGQRQSGREEETCVPVEQVAVEGVDHHTHGAGQDDLSPAAEGVAGGGLGLLCGSLLRRCVGRPRRHDGQAR